MRKIDRERRKKADGQFSKPESIDFSLIQNNICEFKTFAQKFKS